MLTGMCHSWLSFSSFHLQPTYLVQRGSASLQSTGLSIYLPSGDLVKQEEPKKGKKGRWLFVLINWPLSLELNAVYPLFVNWPTWLLIPGSCFPFSVQDFRVVVRIDSWESTSMYPNGQFVRVLGRIGDLEGEIATILVENSISVVPFSEAQVRLPPVLWSDKRHFLLFLFVCLCCCSVSKKEKFLYCVTNCYLNHS